MPKAHNPSGQSTWSETVTVPLEPREAWDLMWRAETLALWLGPDAWAQLTAGGRWSLADEAGVWRRARALQIKTHTEVNLRVEPAVSWGVQDSTRATIRIAPWDEYSSVVTVEESNIPAGRAREVRSFWLARLERFSQLAARVQARRSNVRQALVVIHGIGEQQPGETLRSLAQSGVLSTDETARDMWVKPDYYSDSYELRSITLKATKDRPTTDVFECYWAHVIRDTTMSQIAAWLRRLLLRWPVPAPLRPLWAFAWLLVAVAVTLVAAPLAGVELPRWLAAGSVTVVAAGALWRFLGQPLAIDFLGDAARYLRAHPANIAHRQSIRDAGVTLIERLHESGRYDRIVLLGHSLGSVIAYDIVTHAWMRMHTSHHRPDRPTFKDVAAVERALATPAEGRPHQDVQHDAWLRQRINTQPWLVTDLVTVGSPLTYAEFLIAEGPTEFESAKTDRVLPICPPVTELEKKSGHQRMTFELDYEEPLTGAKRTFMVFHHGAPFAVTRWTNLYFKTGACGIRGDVIGGPIADALGSWVRDVELAAPGPGFAHTDYWNASLRSTWHLKALRAALRLDSRRELQTLSHRRPAFAVLADARRSR